eukprot:GHRR01009000.1.p1 GENE.GHRR01009000.1~~GHRR01009000.1.p1  ORF type:complete len:219 (+),score=48.57 GHRR01009000.1:378-1034(+)
MQCIGPLSSTQQLVWQPVQKRVLSRSNAQAQSRGHHCRCQCSSDASTSGSGTQADVAAAWSLLKTFSQQEFRGRTQQYLGTANSRAELRDALLLVYAKPCIEESWNPALDSEVLLGIVASEARLAVRGLRDWCQAFNLPFVQPDCKVAGASSIARVKGAVYIKYNSKSKVCYLSQYQGADKGVLVQLGPGQLLGHFPLGFFDEAMSNPKPILQQQTEI